MPRKIFDTKVRIESVEKKLSEENLWVSEYSLWKEVWASVAIKEISSRRALYLFSIQWQQDFPRNFRVVMKDKIFTPTQFPVIEPSRNMILFHANIN